MSTCQLSFLHGALVGPFLWAGVSFLLILVLAFIGDALERLAR